MRCAGWLIGARLRAQPTCTPFWSHAVASWYSSGTLRSADEINDRQIGNLAFDAVTLHNVKSVSKSVASLALGIAIDRGLIGGVNEPIFGFFPALSDLRSPEKERMQLVHALTMSMDLKWVAATPRTGDNNDEVRMHMAPDPCSLCPRSSGDCLARTRILLQQRRARAGVGHHP
jgi:hypothetical protein